MPNSSSKMWNWFLESFDETEKKNILLHKYSVIDTSPLYNYILSPLWEKILLITPQFIHPNILSFLAIAFLFANASMISYFDWSVKAQHTPNSLGEYSIPCTVWYTCALFMFLAHLCDGIDGKQARRLKVSSCIGEVIDHGLDSLTMTLIIIVMGSVMAFGAVETNSFEGVTLITVFFFNFYVSHWEKYITGVLFLPWIYDIVMIVCTLLLLSMGITHGKLMAVLKINNSILYKGFKISTYGSAFLVSIPISVFNCYVFLRDKSISYEDVKHYLNPGISFITLFALELCWVSISKVDAFLTHPRIFVMSYGIIFSNITCRLIICQLCKRKCNWFNLLFLLPLFMIINCLFNKSPILETNLAHILFIIGLIVHAVYFTSIIYELRKFLKINVFFVG